MPRSTPSTCSARSIACRWPWRPPRSSRSTGWSRGSPGRSWSGSASPGHLRTSSASSRAVATRTCPRWRSPTIRPARWRRPPSTSSTWLRAPSVPSPRPRPTARRSWPSPGCRPRSSTSRIPGRLSRGFRPPSSRPWRSSPRSRGSPARWPESTAASSSDAATSTPRRASGRSSSRSSPGSSPTRIRPPTSSTGRWPWSSRACRSWPSCPKASPRPAWSSCSAGCAIAARTS